MSAIVGIELGTRKSSRHILRENLEALEKHDEQLVAIAQGTPADTSLSVVFDEDGHANLALAERGAPERLYYLPDVRTALARTFLRNECARARCVVLFGIGAGHELAAMTARAPMARRIVVIESDPDVFRHALRSRALTPLLRRSDVSLLVGLSRATLSTRLVELCKDAATHRYARSMAFVITDGAVAFDREYYQDAMVAVRAALTSEVRAIGDNLGDVLDAFRHALANVPRICDTEVPPSHRARLARTQQAMSEMMHACRAGLEQVRAAREAPAPTGFDGASIDLELLLCHDALRHIRALQRRVIDADVEIGRHFLGHFARPIIAHGEIDAFSLERRARNAVDLYLGLLGHFERWFESLGQLAQISLDLFEDAVGTLDVA